jgi:putative acetyltransferase
MRGCVTMTEPIEYQYASLSLRIASDDAAREIAALHHLVLETSLPYLPLLHTVDEGTVFFADVIRKRTVLVAEVAGAIIAYCAYADGWLDHLYVHPSHQSRGIGSKLLKKAMADSTSLSLWAFQRNVGAIRFYERFGFRIVKKTDGRENAEREPDALLRWSRRERT